MDVYWCVLILGVLRLHPGSGKPILKDMANQVLGPNNFLSNALEQGGSAELGASQSRQESAKNALLSQVRRPPPTSAATLPRLQLPRQPSALDINRGFTRALSVVSILGQIDSYIAERARALMRKLLLLVDDDVTNQIDEY